MTCRTLQPMASCLYKQQPGRQVLQRKYMWRGPRAACGFIAWTSLLQQLPGREALQHQSPAWLAESCRIILPAMVWLTAQDQQRGSKVLQQIHMPGIAC